MPIFVALIPISPCIPYSPTPNVNAVQVSENQYCQWTFHCQDCSRLARKFQGLKVVNAYENVFLFQVERQVRYLFVWDWSLLPKYMISCCSFLSDGAASWHITENTGILINIHSTSWTTANRWLCCSFYTNPQEIVTNFEYKTQCRLK